MDRSMDSTFKNSFHETASSSTSDSQNRPPPIDVPSTSTLKNSYLNASAFDYDRSSLYGTSNTSRGSEMYLADEGAKRKPMPMTESARLVQERRRSSNSNVRTLRVNPKAVVFSYGINRFADEKHEYMIRVDDGRTDLSARPEVFDLEIQVGETLRPDGLQKPLVFGEASTQKDASFSSFY